MTYGDISSYRSSSCSRNEQRSGIPPVSKVRINKSSVILIDYFICQSITGHIQQLSFHISDRFSVAVSSSKGS